VTISDTRTPETDTSGDYLVMALEGAGHVVAARHLIKDDPEQIRSVITGLLAGCDVILTTGGTGIAGRDYTVPIIESLIQKPMPGFGELFRMLSYQEVGGAAMLSRAVGGLADGALIFALPGSKNAVATAWEKLLKDELSHLVFEMVRHQA
jgi:molybdenum cofactor biosynthesis protein B